MKQTLQDCFGSSFHGDTFYATVEELLQILGEPFYSENDGTDKVNFLWRMETEDGRYFTVYDYKHYRILGRNETVEWHIGGRTGIDTYKALEEIAAAYKKL